MKRCPTCNRTYSDPTLSFCLDDGTPLQALPEGGTSEYDPQATVSFDPGRRTEPQPHRQEGVPTIQSSPQPGIHQQQWSPMPEPSPKRRRRVWPWLLGGLVLLGLLVGGGAGLIALLFYIGSKSQTATANSRAANSSIVKANSNGVKNPNANVDSSSADSSDVLDDFSTQSWPTGTDSLGSFWYENDELHARAVAGRYVVEYAPKLTPYYTKDAVVRVTTRSVSGESPKYGYGIVVHGELKNKQLEDYGFLIQNGNSPSYAMVMHREGKETYLNNWTPSAAISTGKAPNQLEVRIKDKRLSFYINGQFINGITDTANYKTGRVGIYTSDTAEVAFDDLQVTH